MSENESLTSHHTSLISFEISRFNLTLAEITESFAPNFDFQIK